ncbi:MAG: hypothetical protein C9356_15250 [Oleiphilus sp.]|nr:MAG: hypothetical protein C9356_15250 [Oleiphilus sp.]
MFRVLFLGALLLAATANASDLKPEHIRLLEKLTKVDLYLDLIPQYLADRNNSQDPLQELYSELNNVLFESIVHIDQQSLMHQYFSRQSSPQQVAALLERVNQSNFVEIIGAERQALTISDEQIQAYLVSNRDNVQMQMRRPLLVRIAEVHQSYYVQLQALQYWINYLAYGVEHLATFNAAFDRSGVSQKLNQALQPYLIVLPEQAVHRAAFIYRDFTNEQLSSYLKLIESPAFAHTIELRTGLVDMYLSQLFQIARTNIFSIGTDAES